MNFLTFYFCPYDSFMLNVSYHVDQFNTVLNPNCIVDKIINSCCIDFAEACLARNIQLYNKTYYFPKVFCFSVFFYSSPVILNKFFLSGSVSINLNIMQLSTAKAFSKVSSICYTN